MGMPEEGKARKGGVRRKNVQEGEKMGMTWKEITAELTKEFAAWGCRYSRKQLPEIAMSYDCTPLFFWNWMDDPETVRTEKGFLRVLGYAWRKYLEEEAEPAPVKRISAATGRRSREAA